MDQVVWLMDSHISKAMEMILQIRRTESAQIQTLSLTLQS